MYERNWETADSVVVVGFCQIIFSVKYFFFFFFWEII